jgi:hypothetical protein
MLAAMLLAIPLSHVANAQKGEDEDNTVLICHISGHDGTGKVIAVDEHSIPGHRNHGDCFVRCGIPGEDCRCKGKPGGPK